MPGPLSEGGNVVSSDRQELLVDRLDQVIRGVIVPTLAVGLAAFQLYTAVTSPLVAMKQRVIHLALIAVLIMLMRPDRSRRWTRYVDYAVAVTALLPAVYMLMNYEAIVLRSGIVLPSDRWMGIILIAIVMIVTKRVMGWPLVIISAISLLYALYGNYIPGAFGHRGYSISRLVSHLYLTTEGILGVPLGASATFIYLFVFLGVLMEKTKTGDVFIQTAYALTGRFRGGPAMTAVVASALFGTLNGSAAANVVTTGTFTIPLMKRTGYSAKVAGAVEAAASSGGQIMPPVMGAAAFVMAELTGIPYIEIAKSALIPALLYFGSLLIAVYLEAGKQNLGVIPSHELPRIGQVIAKRWPLFVPIVVLVYLLVQGFTPMRAGIVAVGTSFLVSLFSADTRLSLRDLVDLCVTAARATSEVMVVCASAGIIAGVMTLTGLGLKLSGIIISGAGGNLFLALVYTAVASLILGMGLPTVAAYLLLAVLVAPGLVSMGVPVIAAHMFIFYFGLISAITPPVAVAAYAAAGISGADPISTGWEAFRLGIVKLIVPFVFVYSPVLLFIGSPGEVLLAFVTAVIGVFFLAAAGSGWLGAPMSPFYRLLLFGASLLLVIPGLYTDALGLALALLTYALWRYLGRRSSFAGTTPV